MCSCLCIQVVLYTLLFSIAIANGKTFAFLDAIKKPNCCWAFWSRIPYRIKASDLILASNVLPSCKLSYALS